MKVPNIDHQAEIKKCKTLEAVVSAAEILSKQLDAMNIINTKIVVPCNFVSPVSNLLNEFFNSLYNSSTPIFSAYLISLMYFVDTGINIFFITFSINIYSQPIILNLNYSL